VLVTLEGTRPLLVEMQALVDSGGPSPRRLSVGLDRDRLAMLLAVLHRHAGVACLDQDVFVNAVGGVRISEPAADLAVLLAIQSSLRGRPLPRGFSPSARSAWPARCGPAPRGQERLREAAKLGFSVAVVPKANAPEEAIEGLSVHAVERIEEQARELLPAPAGVDRRPEARRQPQGQHHPPDGGGLALGRLPGRRRHGARHPRQDQQLHPPPRQHHDDAGQGGEQLHQQHPGQHGSHR
jgi:hypothetical protein